MNQYIEIEYKPDSYFDPNYWEIWIGLNGKYHREKAPSDLYSNGNWSWWFHDELQKRGRDFNWMEIV